MKNYFLGIQGKTALIFFGVFILIILPVNFFVYSNVKRLLAEADSKELIAEGERLLNQVRLDPPAVPLPSIGYSIFLQVGNESKIDSVFASPDFPAFLSDINESEVIEFDTLKIVTLRKPLEYGNGQVTFSIARSNQRLIAQITELRSYLFAANLMAILVAGLVVYWTSGFTLRPIRRIIAVAEHINASKSIERVPVPLARDENRQLALAINEMLSRIEHSVKNQTNFFASAAHELRTPLAVMQTELAVELNKTEDSTARAIFQHQLVEVQRLSQIIQDFLLISQLKSETLTVRKKPEPIDEVIYSSMKRSRFLTQERNIQFKVMIGEAIQSFICHLDRDKIEIVLVNLIENAIKYSPDNSTILIEMKKEDSHFTISVANPLATPIQNMHELKTEFRKSTEFSAGLGMGLWICDQIVTLHQDQLELSQRDGKFYAEVSIGII